MEEAVQVAKYQNTFVHHSLQSLTFLTFLSTETKDNTICEKQKISVEL